MIKLAKILYPTDFSELSLVALKYGLSLAEQFGAQLHCLHVVDDVAQYWLAVGPDGVPVGPDPSELKKTATEQMQKFAQEHLAGANKPVTAIVMGRPFVEIVRYARRETIDLIVIATHGRSGLTHVLMGSVAERVVRKSPCPVLTCRSSEHEFVMP